MVRALAVASLGLLSACGSRTDLSVAPPHAGANGHGYDEPACTKPLASAAAWTRGFGTSGDDVLADVAVDSQGNVFALLWLEATADLGCGPVVVDAKAGLALVALDRYGNALWSRLITDGSTTDAHVIAGSSGPTVVLAPVVPSTVLDEAVQPGLVVVALEPSGRTRRMRAFSGACPGRVSISVGESNNLFIAGWFQGQLDLAGSVVAGRPCSGDPIGSVFVAKLDVEIDSVWARSLGDSFRSESGPAIAVTPADEPVITGMFQGSLSIDGIPLDATGPMSPFILKLDTSGAAVWANQGGGIGVAADDHGMTVVATSNTLGRYRLTRIDAAGARIRQASVDGVEWLASFAGDRDGHAALTGIASAHPSVDGSPLSGNEGDVFVALLDRSGSVQSAASYRHRDEEYPVAIALDGANAIVGGAFKGQADLGSDRPFSGGQRDAFVARLPLGPR